MQEHDKDSEMVHEIIDEIGDVLDGKDIGHIIPALIYVLATAQDNLTMSEEQFVISVSDDLNRWFNVFKTKNLSANKEGLQWLQ